MQIFYCSGCRSRVTSNDLEAGRGIRSGADVYCAQCGRSQETEPDAAAAPEPVSGPHRVRTRTPEPETPAGGRSLTPIITGLGVLIVGLIILLAVLVLNKKTPPAAPAATPPLPSYTEVRLPSAPGPAGPAGTIVSEPAEPAVTEAAPAAEPTEVPGIPERGYDRFPASDGYVSLIAGNLEQYLKPLRGGWQAGTSVLTTAVGGEQGAAIIQTAQWQGNYELGLRLAVQDTSTVELRLNEQNQGSARCNLLKTAPGTWHVLSARVNGAVLEKLELDGTDLLTGVVPAVRVNREGMPANGAIRLIVNTADFEASTIAVAEFALKKIEGAAAGNVRTMSLLNTDRGELFKDGTKGVPENPPGADAGQYLKVTTGAGGWAGMWGIPEKDWSGYTRLVFDYYNPESTEYTLTMKFGDAAARAVWAWDEGAILKTPIGPGFGRAEAPLAGMKNGKGRVFDLAQIEIWHLLPDSHTIYVRNVRLEADL